MSCLHIFYKNDNEYEYEMDSFSYSYSLSMLTLSTVSCPALNMEITKVELVVNFSGLSTSDLS